jgi:hypothetical protein
MSRVLELNMVPIYQPDSGMLLADQEMQAAHLRPDRSGPQFGRMASLRWRGSLFSEPSGSATVGATVKDAVVNARRETRFGHGVLHKTPRSNATRG